MYLKVLLILLFCFFAQNNHSQEYDNNQFTEAGFNSDTIKQRLERLNVKTPIEIYHNKEVEKLIIKYLKTRKSFYEKNSSKMQFYFPLFEEHLLNKSLPLELKYLPIIESRLDPSAVSKVGATGLWQLMFYTAVENGLELNSYVDERMDPLKSTIAATNYLQKLYNIHHDWNLVLASYNAGPRTTLKAIKRSGGYKNYWNIRPFLPRETANYIPSFIATMYVLEYYAEHGIKLNIGENLYKQLDTIKIAQKVSFDHVSALLGISKDSIKKLNPSFIHEIIPANKNYTIALPKKAIDSFIQIEKNIYEYSSREFDKAEKPLPELYSLNSKVIYTVKYGDFLGKISKRFGVKVGEIKKWNNLQSDNIKENQKLIIFPKKIPIN